MAQPSFLTHIAALVSSKGLPLHPRTIRRDTCVRARVRMPNKKSRNPKKVMKIAPERPEARDEGPRLIPLKETRSTDQFGRRALELADIALGLRPARNYPKKKMKGPPREDLPL